MTHFWNLSIFVSRKNLKVKVKTSSFIKKKLSNFTKVVKCDDKFNQLSQSLKGKNMLKNGGLFSSVYLKIGILKNFLSGQF